MRGFGFVTAPDGTDVFLHIKSCVDGNHCVHIYIYIYMYLSLSLHIYIYIYICYICYIYIYIYYVYIYIYIAQQLATTCAPSCVCPRSRTTSEVAVLRALGLCVQ